MTGLDRQRADAAGQQIAPVPGLASRPRRGWPGGSRLAVAGGGVRRGGSDRADAGLLRAERAAALASGAVTIDLDTTDVEVYGRKKRGVAYNHQGQRVGLPTWRPGPRQR